MGAETSLQYCTHTLPWQPGHPSGQCQSLRRFILAGQVGRQPPQHLSPVYSLHCRKECTTETLAVTGCSTVKSSNACLTWIHDAVKRQLLQLPTFSVQSPLQEKLPPQKPSLSPVARSCSRGKTRERTPSRECHPKVRRGWIDGRGLFYVFFSSRLKTPSKPSAIVL